MLARLMVKDEIRVSGNARDYFEHLRAPLAETCFLKGHHDDIGESLPPLLGFALTLLSTRALFRTV
jgi:hypothetical protein